MVDDCQKRIGIVDDRSLVKQHELGTPDNLGLRSTLLVQGYLFAGFSNGILHKLDSETLEIEQEIQLHTHVFCIEMFDEDHIVCG